MSVNREKIEYAITQNPINIGKKAINNLPIRTYDLPRITAKLNLPVIGNTWGNHNQAKQQVSPSIIKFIVKLLVSRIL